MNKRFLLPPFIILMALSLSACGSSVERTLESGNQAFSEGAFEDALVDYSEAMEMAPSLAEPAYNLANTLYRLGAFEEAGGLLSRATEIASAELAEHGFYNLGNNFFQQQQMELSIEAYKEALRLDPNDMDAKYNLELAMLQQEQQEQQQQEQQEQQEGQEQNEQSQSEDGQGDQDESEQGEQQGENDQNEPDQGEGDQEQDGNPQDSQNPDGDPQEEGGSGQPQQAEGLTEEQAKQLLAAIGQATKTLQEKLEEINVFMGQPPAKDW